MIIHVKFPDADLGKIIEDWSSDIEGIDVVDLWTYEPSVFDRHTFYCCTIAQPQEELFFEVMGDYMVAIGLG